MNPVSGSDSGTARKILSLQDLGESALKNLSTSAAEFYNSGSTEQITIRDNSAAFNKYRLRPRVLRDVSKADMSTTVLGQKVAFPLGISPAGLQRMAHNDGEVGTSRACAKFSIPMAISSFANYSVEEIVQAGQAITPIPHAMQLYTMKDKALQERIIRRADAMGVKAIFLTADSPVLGVRYNEWRNDFRTPEGLEFPIMDRTTEMIRSQTHDDGFNDFNSASHSWEKEIPWLRSMTKMQIWIKGVVTAEDVQTAIEHGCDGVIVSNHGGRQLDGIPATIDVLAECVEAAQGRIRVHMDGGVRSGSDIFKALALGAECCWIGRPAIWGLAHDGQAGVELAIKLLYDDFKRCMQLMGCNTVADIKRSCLGRVGKDGVYAKL